MAAPIRLVFSRQDPGQTHVQNYTNGAVVTPQAAVACRMTPPKALDLYFDEVQGVIRLQDFHDLSSEFLVELALFDCTTVTRTAASSGFPGGIIKVARQEREALKKLKQRKRFDAAAQRIRQNEAWIVSVFEVWKAIH